MKHILTFLLYLAGLLLCLILVKFSRAAVAVLPLFEEFGPDNITDLICAAVPFFTGILLEFLKSLRDKEQLRQEHEHQLAMQAKEFENSQKRQDEANKAVIAQIEKAHALELENQRLKWEREDQAAEEDRQRQRSAESARAYSTMVDAVSDYLNKHDLNFKTTAQKAIRAFLPHTAGSLRAAMLELENVITMSSAFDGPNPGRVLGLLKLIEDQLADDSP